MNRCLSPTCYAAGMLQDELNRMREASTSKMPSDVVSLIHRSTDELRATGILDGVLKPGDAAPAFELMSNAREAVSLASL